MAFDSNSNGDEEIVVLGGKSENWTFLKTVEALDIETRTWTAMPVWRPLDSVLIDRLTTRSEGSFVHQAGGCCC